MIRINDNQKVGLTISGAMFAIGYLGGQTVQSIIPGVSSMGYGLSLGLWYPGALAMHQLAETVNKRGGYVNKIFAVLSGYLASWAATNLMGFSVSMISPFIGATTLTVVTGIVCVIAVPAIMCFSLAVGYRIN